MTPPPGSSIHPRFLVLQVDDCIAKYNWMKSMTAALALRRQQGKPAPKSVEEMESILGNWRSYKQAHMQVQPPGQAAPGETGQLAVPPCSAAS